MQMLYDSETFCVVHMDGNEGGLTPRHGFEIVDKEHNTQVYLDGPFAKMFQSRIEDWNRQTPTQDEVEDYLEGLTAMANPLSVH